MNKLNTTQWLFVFLFFVIQIISESSGDEPGTIDDDPNDQRPILKLSGMPEYKFGQYHLDINAGVLDVDTIYDVKLAIENPSNELMVFRNIETSCACFEAKASSMSIPDGKAVEIDFSGPVPKKMLKPEAFWRLRLQPDNETDLGGITVIVHFKIAGLLGFFDKQVVLEAGGNQTFNDFAIPMIMSAPVASSNVSVQLPDTFSDVEAKVVSVDDKSFLSLRITGELLQSNYVAGEIKCVDSVTGIEDAVYCVIRRKALATVSPGILRAKIKDKERSSYVISAIVSVVPSDDKTDENKATKRPAAYLSAIINATYDGKPLSLDLTPMSAEVARVNIELSERVVKAMKESSKPSINWLIQDKESSCELRSLVSFVE